MSKKPLSNIAAFRPIASVQNEKFVLPDDGKFQLVPLGNAPNFIGSPDGKSAQKIMQVCDQEALEALRNHANALADALEAQGLPAELPTDFYHKQQDASCWVQLRTGEIRNDGLWFAGRLTEDGDAAVKGGKARFLSPNFSIKGLVLLKNEKGVKHVRPTEFDDVWLGGLTNQHNFRSIKPVSNEAAQLDDKPETAPEIMPPWRLKLINALVLQGFLASATADDAAVDASIDKLTNHLDALNAERLTNDLEKYKAVIPAGQEDFIKGMIKNDRPAALKYLDGCLAAAPQTKATDKPEEQVRLTNGQHKPNGLQGKIINDAEKAMQRQGEQTKLVNECIKEIGRTGPGVYEQAWDMASRRNPELFTDPAE